MLGVSRGGLTTKVHALSDAAGRPLDFAQTAGRAADCVAADLLWPHVPQGALVRADRRPDTTAVDGAIEALGATPNISPKVNRGWKPRFSRMLWGGRNAIKRMFGGLKVFRRVATRYNNHATNGLAGLRLAAALCYLLRISILVPETGA